MKKSQHIRTRCQQRGIPEDGPDLIAYFGTETSDGVILTGKDISDAERKMKREMKRIMNRLSKLKDVFIPIDGTTMKTAYRVGRRRRRLQTGRW